MKLVLDSNVYIAAFLAKGLASDIVKLAEKEKLEIYTSNEILEEVKEKLTTRGKLDQSEVEELIATLKKTIREIEPEAKVTIVKEDPEDNKILECAISAKADLIVSMDKHLLKLKKYQNIGIVHPKTLTWIIPQLLS